eukprot:14748239-Heterocapsa_arctica.AAC.1
MEQKFFTQCHGILYRPCHVRVHGQYVLLCCRRVALQVACAWLHAEQGITLSSLKLDGIIIKAL